MTSTALGLGISSALLFPYLAFANVEITEIMYDTPGSDSGREWVEVTNTGAENLDIGKYKLFENATNHGLTLVSGSSMLAAGTSAILADNPTKFLADYPSYAGPLFNTAFSLSNSGESLAIKDAGSSTLDSIAYAAMADADGTGGSLHRQGQVFVAAMPNPGVYPGTLQPIIKTAPPAAPAKVPTASKTVPAKKKPAGNSTPKTYTPTAPVAAASPAAQVAAPAESPAVPQLFLWAFAAVAVVLLGIAGVLFARTDKKESALTASDFKIE